MGYRPSIYEIVDGETGASVGRFVTELGKFYGYVKLDDLSSIKWLIDHGKIDDGDQDLFGYGCGPQLHFTADEFREWLNIYEEDINNFNFEEDSYIKYDKPFRILDHWPELKDTLESNNDKFVELG